MYEKEEERNWDLVQEAVRRNLVAGEREVCPSLSLSLPFSLAHTHTHTHTHTLFFLSHSLFHL